MGLISLRKHIDGHREPVPEELTGAYRVALLQLFLAVGQAGSRAVPYLAGSLKVKMGSIQDRVASLGTAQLSPIDCVKDTVQKAQKELDAWAELASAHHQENEREIREIIGMVAGVTESLAQRDEKHASDVAAIATRMRSAAGINDLPAMRRSIMEGAQALQQCVEKMAAENRDSIRQLTLEVKNYQKKLAASEHASKLDFLTGLANRLAFEAELASFVSAGKPFSLILIDLNQFKAVNDNYGHLTGDELLRQFSVELRAQFRSDDRVGRWGGDEFVVIVPGELEEANARVERVRRWALGEYRIPEGDGRPEPVRVRIGASISVVSWNGIETGQALVAKADDLLYKSKRNSARLTPADRN